jgi:hypothetical protein
MKKILLIGLIFVCRGFLIADSNIDGKTVSFTEFIDEMVKADKNTTFENVKVRYVMNIDKQGMDHRFDNGGPEIYVKQRIRWLNCDFDLDYWLVMRGVTFEDYLAVFECKPIKAIFKNCTFKKTFRLYTSEVEFIDFDTCNFEHGFKCGRSTIKDHLKFSACKLSVNPNIQNPTNEYDMEARVFLIAEKNDPVDLTIQGCEFNVPQNLKDDPQYFVNLTASSFSNLRLINNKFNAHVDFSQSTVSNTFMTYDCAYNGKILLDAFNINPINTRVQWSTVKDYRVAVYEPKSKQIYHGGMIDSIHDEFIFNNLISCYASFYSAFKAQGNKIGANECYVEWKNIETRYMKNVYKSEGGKKKFFNYIMNVFLSTFCDYGTNPLKAINIALYVLLAFAGIYFFFPYTVKAFCRRTLFEQLKLYGYYLSSPRSLLEIEDAEFTRNKEPKSYAEYISFLKQAGRKVPWYFHIFAKPVYYLEKARAKPSYLFYRFIDWFPDEWENLKGSKKLFASVVYGFVVLFTIIWYLIIHTLDSIMLSLNVFSTLGFGQIPIKGIPRYLTIIEGFVGWFLLSIFSVSLISQVIQ